MVSFELELHAQAVVCKSKQCHFNRKARFESDFD